MKSNAPLALVACLVASACGGGGGRPSANVTVEFPNLFQQGADQILPTYISHVITSDRYPLARVTIANSGPPETWEVGIDLPNYGQPTSQTIATGAGETKAVYISPAINYAQLFANTTTLPAQLSITLKASGSSIFQQSYPIQISGRDTVFWANNGQSTVELIATMVTPTDKNYAVATLLSHAALRIPGGQVLGYQLGAWPSTAATLSPSHYLDEAFYLLQGESPGVSIDDVVITSTGTPDTSFTVFIMDDANFQAWSAGSTTATACALSDTAGAGTVLTCTSPPQGNYHIVYFNPSTNVASRTVTRHRPMTKWETTYYQSAAIFEQLRAQGMIYVDVPGGTSFFSSSQNVKYPSESLALTSANCLEGALVFASAWEAMQMEPILVVDPAHGHAFVGVRCWHASTCLIPVETTLVGGTATFDDAYVAAYTNWTNWTADNTLVTVDVAAARALGLTPAPM